MPGTLSGNGGGGGGNKLIVDRTRLASTALDTTNGGRVLILRTGDGGTLGMMPVEGGGQGGSGGT